jgi:stearoyl-CoA 9-desaturase NADPH oxidoreductase
MSEHMFTLIYDVYMKTSAVKALRPITSVRRIWRHPLLAPFNQLDAWNSLVSRANPLWSLTEAKARVVRVVDEAPGVKSIWLKPNRHFQRFDAGQHVLLSLDINGARHARCFSLSHAPRDDGLIRITIKRKNNGPVSNAAHALSVGQIVRLGQAQGSFAPRDASNKLLLLSAGSGITPMLAQLQQLFAEKKSSDVVLLHTAQSQNDFIFQDELAALAKQWPQFKYYFHATQLQGRLSAEIITTIIPDWDRRETLLCGPDSFMQMIETMYANTGCNDNLQSESFGRRAAPIDTNANEYSVSSSSTIFNAKAGQTILDAAEAAGLQPKFGCRRGICRTCQCKKLSGTVTNLLTGQISGPGEELIQLCISSPQSALELAL